MSENKKYPLLDDEQSSSPEQIWFILLKLLVGAGAAIFLIVLAYFQLTNVPGT